MQLIRTIGRMWNINFRSVTNLLILRPMYIFFKSLYMIAYGIGSIAQFAAIAGPVMFYVFMYIMYKFKENLPFANPVVERWVYVMCKREELFKTTVILVVIAIIVYSICSAIGVGELLVEILNEFQEFWGNRIENNYRNNQYDYHYVKLPEWLRAILCSFYMVDRIICMIEKYIIKHIYAFSIIPIGLCGLLWMFPISGYFSQHDKTLNSIVAIIRFYRVHAGRGEQIGSLIVWIFFMLLTVLAFMMIASKWKDEAFSRELFTSKIRFEEDSEEEYTL